MNIFNMGPRTYQSDVQDIEKEKENAKMYVLRNYVKDSPKYNEKLGELGFLFTNYKFKPMGEAFKYNQTYWIFNSKRGWQQGKCTGNDDLDKRSNFTFGNNDYDMVNWEQPGWYRSGISAYWNPKKSFFNYNPDNPDNPAGGKRRKLIRKKSQRRSRQRRSRQRTQRRSSQSQRQRTQRRR